MWKLYGVDYVNPKDGRIYGSNVWAKSWEHAEKRSQRKFGKKSEIIGTKVFCFKLFIENLLGIWL